MKKGPFKFILGGILLVGIVFLGVYFLKYPGYLSANLWPYNYLIKKGLPPPRLSTKPSSAVRGELLPSWPLVLTLKIYLVCLARILPASFGSIFPIRRAAFLHFRVTYGWMSAGWDSRIH